MEIFYPSVLLAGSLAGWLAGWLALILGWLALRPGWLALRPGWLALSPAWLALRPAWLALRPDWLGLRPAWLALGPLRGGTDGRMDRWTVGKAPHSTGLRPLSGPLPCYSPTSTQKLYKAGQGYR